MRKNCHYDKANDKIDIEISANANTLKSEMFLKNNYEVDFRKDISINSLLGFHSNLYTSGSHISDDTKQHYCCIKDINKLLYLQTSKVGHVKHVCFRCLNTFKTEK